MAGKYARLVRQAVSQRGDRLIQISFKWLALGLRLFEVASSSNAEIIFVLL